MNNGINNYGNKYNIETWKIIVIIICCLIFAIILIIVFFIIRKKRIIKNMNKDINKYKNSNDIEIIYEKPDLKDTNVFNLLQLKRELP
jgi:uncharacterized membrane protein